MYYKVEIILLKKMQCIFTSLKLFFDYLEADYFAY